MKKIASSDIKARLKNKNNHMCMSDLLVKGKAEWSMECENMGLGVKLPDGNVVKIKPQSNKNSI